MAQETELKLRLNADDLPRLLAHPLLQAVRPRRQRLFNTYFDTPSLALMAQRIAVRERRIGRRTLLTVKTAGTSTGGLSQRGEWEGPTTPGVFDFEALVDHPDLARDLAAQAWQLVPVFRTDFHRTTWQLDHGGGRIEVALDQGFIRTGRGRGPQAMALLELELELTQGPVDALLALALELTRPAGASGSPALWLLPDDRSKAHRGLALFQGQTPHPVRAGEVPLRPDMGPVAAFRQAALQALAQLQANTHGLIDAAQGTLPPDPEFVHQARVALRRLRTGLQLFDAFLPPRFVRRWRRHWKDLHGALAETRNWDVFATELLPALAPPSGEPAPWSGWTAWAAAQRQTATGQVVARLGTPGHARAVLRFTRELLALPEAHRPRRSLAGWARQTVHRQHQRLRTHARQALREDAEARHALRLDLKRLRYTQDFLASLLPAAARRRSDAALRRAQDRLGHWNDLDTALGLLERQPRQRPPGRRALRQALERQLARGLKALPTLEKALVSTPSPWR